MFFLFYSDIRNPLRLQKHSLVSTRDFFIIFCIFIFFFFSMLNSLAHVEINVDDIQNTKSFYDIFLNPLWRKGFVTNEQAIGYKAPDKTHIFFTKTSPEYAIHGFHRKHIWLNHLAFRVDTKQQVDDIAQYLEKNGIPLIYIDKNRDYSDQYDMEEYYAIFCEDPDRIKVEIVYCK